MNNPLHELGKHLASLNLFREADGTVRITVASAKGAISELDEKGKLGATLPIDYVNSLIAQAAGGLALKNLRDQYGAFSAMRNDLNGMFGNMISQDATLLTGPELSAECAAVVTSMVKVRNHLNEACRCLYDIIACEAGDIDSPPAGDCYHNAERFLKAHAPDLYDRIGVQKPG